MIRKGHIYSICFVLVVLGIFCLFRSEITYSSDYSSIFIYINIFVVLPFFLYRALKNYGMTNEWLMKIIPAFILVAGISVGFTDKFYREYRMEHSENIIGNVREKYFSNSRVRGWYLVGEFTLKGKKYTTPSTLQQTTVYKVGDYIQIRYSKANPAINELVIN